MLKMYFLGRLKSSLGSKLLFFHQPKFLPFFFYIDKIHRCPLIRFARYNAFNQQKGKTESVTDQRPNHEHVSGNQII